MFVDEKGELIDVTKFEVTEQEQCAKYIRPHHQVLELGARYGTVSCIINKLLDDKTKHVAVEPDLAVIPALTQNRDAHGCQFHIVDGVITPCNMYMRTFYHLNQECAYGNFTMPVEKACANVKNFTLEDIQQKYNIQFNCLVADCEGFLEQFLRENPGFIKGIDTAIVEYDGPERCNYDYVKQVFTDNGLRCVVDGGIHAVWTRT
jgi:FkbM family methyltransferase